jgi:hypothetical protein
VSSADVVNLVVGTLTGILSSTAFVLALFLGFCIILGFPKLRPTTGRRSMVVKNLEERVGQQSFARYLSPSAPHGPVDVLKTPELLEHAKH